VPSLVPIKKREGGRRPPWIGCELCLDLNEIFLVCILFCVGSKSEIFLHVFNALISVWFCSLRLPARFSSVSCIQFFSTVLRPGPFRCSSVRVLGFRRSRVPSPESAAVFLFASSFSGAAVRVVSPGETARRSVCFLVFSFSSEAWRRPCSCSLPKRRRLVPTLCTATR
jgi:hypothetical protein